MARKRTDSHALAVEYFKAAGKRVEPPNYLSVPERAMPFWDDIIATRAPDNWTPADFLQAANLAMVYADINHYQKLMDENGRLADSDPLATKPSGLHKVLSDLYAQAQSLSRALQVHARATQGESQFQANRNKLFAQARAAVGEEGGDDLLAKPRH